MQHRPHQPFSGAGSVRPVQSPNLTTGQPNQPSYAFPGLFSPQAGLQSPFQAHHPSPYPPQASQNSQQPPPEQAYYSANPSPRSTHSTSYYSKDTPETMAAATATMQRPPYPTIYHTPQSNSPASVTSPQTHEQGRAMFAAPSQLTPSMYSYPGYSSIGQVQQPVYGGHHPPTQLNPPPLLPYQSPAAGMPQHHPLSAQPNLQASPTLREDPTRHYAQNSRAQTHGATQPTPPVLHQRHAPATTPTSHGLGLAQHPAQHPAPPSTSNAAPGPIPATTPLVVHQDANGVQWIAFEYSRDRVKLEYTIRCDVESVEHANLSPEFKSENCVYPRACVPKEQYKGNRLSYETECNQVGWALAELNPCLRGKRGLIQRAVDSWRNSNRDPRLRSRRVRRQAKIQSRSKVASQATPSTGSTSSLPGGLSSSSPLGPPGSRVGNAPSSASLSQPQPQHHHHAHDGPQGGPDTIGGPPYGNMHRPGSATPHLTSPTDLRQAHSYPGYQPYPTAPASLGSSMAPPLHSSMHQYGRAAGNAPM